MQKISLKEMIEDDYDDYYIIRSSPADIYWNGYVDKPNKEEFKKLFLQRLGNASFEKEEDKRLYLIQLECEDVVYNIGFIQLTKREDGTDIAYTVVEKFQGYGYATEALKLGINQAKEFGDNIYVQIRDDNIPSQKVAKKCGFVATDEYIENKYPKVGIVKLRKHRLMIKHK